MFQRAQLTRTSTTKLYCRQMRLATTNGIWTNAVKQQQIEHLHKNTHNEQINHRALHTNTQCALATTSDFGARGLEGLWQRSLGPQYFVFFNFCFLFVFSTLFCLSFTFLCTQKRCKNHIFVIYRQRTIT